MTFASEVESLDRWLAQLRADSYRRRLALLLGVTVGLALAWLHWSGLVVGGALVGLSRRSVPRAALAGLLFGVLVTIAGFVLTPTIGPVEFLGLERISAVTAAIGLLFPAWGAMLRAAV